MDQGPEEDRSVPLRTHSGLSFAQRLKAEESYGILFCFIIISLTATAVLGGSHAGRGVVTVLQAGVLLFALWTSRSGKRVLRLAIILVPIAAAVAILTSGIGSDIAGELGAVTNALFTVLTVVAIVGRLAAHPRIDGTTIMGVLCVYLLFGTFFASTFRAVAAFSGDPFFATAGAGSQVDFVYFSFVTLSTTGYGDLTAATDLGRMLAVTEALLGQLYLVSVVAVVVANLGRERRRPIR